MPPSRDQFSSLLSAGDTHSSGASGRFALPTEAQALAVLDDGCRWLRTLTGFEASVALVLIERDVQAGGQKRLQSALGTLKTYVYAHIHAKDAMRFHWALQPFFETPRRGFVQVPGERWRCPNCGSSRARHPSSDSCWDCAREEVGE